MCFQAFITSFEGVFDMLHVTKRLDDDDVTSMTYALWLISTMSQVARSHERLE